MDMKPTFLDKTFLDNSGIGEGLDEVMKTLLYEFYKNRETQIGNASEQVNIQKLEAVIKCVDEEDDWSKIDLLALMGNVVDVLKYLRANFGEFQSYHFMLFFHHEMMNWLVTDKRYFTHMMDEAIG